MELRHLKYFLVVADELHFGRAAKKLRISQPPLSRQIKQLEEELGIPLFQRTKKSVRITAYGKFLKEEASRLLEGVELMRNHVRLLGDGCAGQIRIGYVGSAMHSVLPEVLRTVREKFPGIHTSMIEMKNLDQIAGLRDGSIDIGFVRMPMTVEDLQLRTVLSETLSIILPLSHPMAGRKRIPLAALAGDPFIAFCRECAPGLFDQITGLCQKEGFTPRIVHESSQINSVVRLVESGLGYSIVPTSVKRGYDLKVRFAELRGYPERAELAVAYHPAHQSPASERVLDLVLGLAGQMK